MIIDFFTPTRVIFGRGRFADLGRHARELGGHALVVCGRRAMRKYGVLNSAVVALESAGIRVTVADLVSPNPRSTEVDRAVAIAKKSVCDMVIGLGGGSAIDAAKATAVGMRLGPVGPLVATTISPDEHAVPVLAVPTTAGSGAEVTKGAIITDVARNLKAGIRGDTLFPTVALIDPALTETVPVRTAVESGFDALAHSIEGYVARQSTVLTRLLAESALGILGRRLRQVAQRDITAGLRDDLALAALYGGINVANASTCLPHRLQQALGSAPGFTVSHGRGLAAVYRSWISHAHPFAPDGFNQVAELLGSDDIGRALDAILTEVGLGEGLVELGFDPSHLDAVLSNVVGNIDNDPMGRVDSDVIRTVCMESL